MNGCVVYKSLRQADTYLFLAERDGFDVLPEALAARLGRLEFVMELELHVGRRLARARPEAVREALAERGYYLQLPPPKTPLLANDRLPA